MDPESIFTIIFIIVVLSIPFGFGLGLWRALNKRKEIENQFAEAKYSSGRVIGYTERIYNTENIKHYYAVIEYRSDQNDLVWAESESCNKEDYSINSQVDVMYNPHDKRNVMIVLNQSLLKAQFNFEKQLGLYVNIIFTILIFSSAIYYHGLTPRILIPLLLSYFAGFAFGVVTNNKNRLEEKLRVQSIEDRNMRLSAAQKNGTTPCYLKE